MICISALSLRKIRPPQRHLVVVVVVVVAKREIYILAIHVVTDRGGVNLSFD